MDRLRSMEIFVKVAEAESFAEAADRMSLPRSSVTRAVKALETHLGVTLIRRSTRRFSLTHEGQLCLVRARRLIEDMADLEDNLSAESASPRGTVRVNTTALIAQHLLVPLLPQFHSDYPEIAIRLTVSDSLVDIIGSGLDCVIRAGPPEDSPSISTRQLGSFDWGIYAAPIYLKNCGEPLSVDALEKHDFVGYHGGGRDYLRVAHKTGEAKLHPVSWLTLDDTGSYIEAAIQGIGLILAADFLAAPHVRAGRLQRILHELRLETTPIHLIQSHSSFPSPALRAFRRWLVKNFSATEPGSS